MIEKDARLGHVDRLHHLLELGVIKDWSIAIDGGANVGMWSAAMAQRFDRVIGFEPVPETFETYQKNVADYLNVECRNEALMDRAGSVIMKMPKYRKKFQRAYGKTHNDKPTARYARWIKKSAIKAVTIDSLKLPSCGLIKLDLEGAEPLALIGAKKTIREFGPVLAVEFKHSVRYGFPLREVDRMLIDMGYRLELDKGRDRFYVRKKRG